MNMIFMRVPHKYILPITRGLLKSKQGFLSCDIEMTTKINVGASVESFGHRLEKGTEDEPI